MLKFIEKKNGTPLPEVFKTKGFRSFADMAAFADTYNLPDGEYYIKNDKNDKGGNLLTHLREVKRRGSQFWVEGRGYI